MCELLLLQYHYLCSAANPATAIQLQPRRLCISRSGAGGRKLAHQAGLHEYASTSSRSFRRPSHHALQEPSALLLPFGVPQQGCLPNMVGRYNSCLPAPRLSHRKPTASSQSRIHCGGCIPASLHLASHLVGLSSRPSEAVIDTIVAADTNVSGCSHLDARFLVSMPPQWQ